MQKIDLNLRQFGITATDAYFEELGPKRAFDGMLKRMRCRVAGESQSPFIYETATSWWQQFKVEYFPKWALRRWPAKMTQHKVELRVLYPMLKVSLPRDTMGPMVTVILGDATYSIVTGTDGLSPREYYKAVNRVRMMDQYGIGEKCPTCNRLWFDKYA
jgi:hypothetical protein